MTDALTLLIDQLGDAPFPNATALAREVYLQQCTTQIFRLLLARIETLERNRSRSTDPGDRLALALQTNHSADSQEQP